MTWDALFSPCCSFSLCSNIFLIYLALVSMVEAVSSFSEKSFTSFGILTNKFIQIPHSSTYFISVLHKRRGD